jgi:hypothetical protein
MPAFVNTFNIGTDLSLTIKDNTTGATVLLDGKKTSFNIRSKDHMIQSSPIDSGGVPDHRNIPAGWSGSIEVDRQNDGFTALMVALEQAYFAGGQQRYFTITLTVQRPDGSGAYRYSAQNSVFHSLDFGSFTKEAKVSARYDFDCAQFNKLS